MIERDPDARHESRLHTHFAYFLKKWPQKDEDREFEADLFMLCRTIHDDAARPFAAILTHSLALSTFPLHSVQPDRQWRTMESAPTDGTIIEVAGRYPDATSGFPRYVGYRDGKWFEHSRFEPQEIIPWRWRPRTEWPREESQS